MKIRNRMLLAVIGRAGSFLLRVWMGSLRCQLHFHDSSENPLTTDCAGNHVIVIWHENLLLAAHLLGKVGQYTIISKSDDGEYIARIVERVGLKVIRGSSSRGAVPAIRELLRVAQKAERIHIGMTTDGPRGPRRVLKPGAIYIASKAGMVIQPVGIAFERPWRARSWDRFALPRPFSRAVVVGAKPIAVPKNISRDQLEAFQLHVQEVLTDVQEQAERVVNDPTHIPLQRTRQAA